MTPSVPDWGLARAFGVGDACWVGVVALERPSGREWPRGGGSGTRTSACTDISPTSLHNRLRRDPGASGLTTPTRCPGRMYIGASTRSSQRMIKAIRFQNYKVLRDTTLPLGPFTLLIG